MTAQPLAPVIPSSGRPGCPAARPVGRGPAAAAGPPGARPSLPEDVVYGIARIDSSGRIATGPSSPRWAGRR